jgi:4-alpha-glucanotransferase
MSGPERDALARLAVRHRVLPAYVDTGGRLRRAAPAPLCAVLRLLGVPIDRPGEARGLLAESWKAGNAPVLPPVTVRHPDTSQRLGLTLRPPVAGTTVRATLQREDRRSESAELPVVRGAKGRASIELPFAAPIGYHILDLQGDGWSATTNLFVAPRTLVVPPSARRRSWGLCVPAYAVRGERTWGMGDLSSLREVVRWAGERGASFVGTLPLTATFPDGDPSPYLPVSRRFWNEAFADPTVAPEYRRSREVRALVRKERFQRDLARLRRRATVDFLGVTRLKRPVFGAMLRHLESTRSARRARFRRFVNRTPELDRYAQFRAARESRRAGSRNAPEPVAVRSRQRRGAEYHRYVQWLVQDQLRSLAREGRRYGVRLYLDLPVGVHPNGFDASDDSGVFVHGAEIGSPPDPGTPDGQQWGMPPPHPERLREAAYRTFRATVRAQLEVAGALRVDHVMGFHRLFWVPAGFSARDGVYVRYRPEEYNAVLLIEAFRAGAVLVGEDLGTVPPEVRRDLRAHGVLRSFVAQLEWDRPGPGGRYAPPPSDALASLNNHDMLPFAAFWRARRRRNEAKGSGPSVWPPATMSPRRAHRAAAVRLARSPARIVLVGLEDLEGGARRQNVPGYAGRGRRNFVGRMRTEWTEFSSDPEVLATLAEVDAARRDGGRR